MSTDRQPIRFDRNGDRRVVAVGAVRAETLADLVAAVPDLTKADNLGRYCDAVNYLARGEQYRPIHNPDAFRRRYEARYQAEDPAAPFQEGAPRLRDFGHCDTAEITLPRVDGTSVVFYAEDTYLGIPYRVTAPGPAQPTGDPTYEPLPMVADPV